MAIVCKESGFLLLKILKINNTAPAYVFLAHHEAIEAGAFLEINEHLPLSLLKLILFIDKHMNF